MSLEPSIVYRESCYFHAVGGGGEGVGGEGEGAFFVVPSLPILADRKGCQRDNIGKSVEIFTAICYTGTTTDVQSEC
jgi:hypothetical protein